MYKKIFMNSEGFLLYSVFSEVQAILRNVEKVPSLVFGSFLSLFTKQNTLHESRKLEKLVFKRMLDGRSEWRGTSGSNRVTTQ